MDATSRSAVASTVAIDLVIDVTVSSAGDVVAYPFFP